MIDIAAAVPTPRPRAVPAPARVVAADFKDTLNGLSEAPTPTADVSRVLLGAKGGDFPPVLSTLGKATEPQVSRAPDLTAGLPPVDPESLSVTTETGAAPPLLLVPTGKRQATAETGKTLPIDTQDDGDEVVPIWLPVGMMPAALPMTSPAATLAAAMEPHVAPTTDPVSSNAAAALSLPATPAEAGAQSGEAIASSLPSPDRATASAGVAGNGEASIALARNTMTTSVPPLTARPDLPVRPDDIDAANPPVVPLQQAPLQPAPAILPAGQAFAAAIAAVVQQGRDERESAETPTPVALATAALDRLHAPAVTAPADARQAALDLRQDSGLQGMIDHIEVLRDGANAGDTRIRLVPDALGAVDVSVRCDGDRLHVHFNAETQASARLIADAQPRLAELADARGVKLGQTSVDSGDAQSRQHQPATPIQFTRPAAASDPVDTTDDVRVA